MILGLGVDLVSIDRMTNILLKHCGEFERRFFSIEEITNSPNKRSSNYYAKRFAAKEALIKAVGVRGNISMRGISVTNDISGKPIMNLESDVHNYIQKLLGNFRIHLSLSDDGIYAVACLVIESCV